MQRILNEEDLKIIKQAHNTTIEPDEEIIKIGEIDKVVCEIPGHKYAVIYGGSEENLYSQQGIQFIEGGRNTQNCVPGITHQALLLIVIDRLKYFQKQFPMSNENDTPIKLLELALELMDIRTLERAGREVLGNNGEDYKYKED